MVMRKAKAEYSDIYMLKKAFGLLDMIGLKMDIRIQDSFKAL